VLSAPPRVRLVPRGSGSEADDACELASGYGLTPDDWQAMVLSGWLALRRDGLWAAPRCGLAVPRQNGKNGILEVRELYGLVFRGEKFLHTAHEVKTARKAFLRLLHFFDNPRKFPELAELVKEVRRTNGQEAVVLDNGGSVEFIARSKGSGRGFTVDVLVCDEAQELSDDTLAALRPTISAAPLGNPQLILTGTPPSESMNGEVFTRMRQAGVDGNDRRLCWLEWSCTPGVDVTDREYWYAANPALGSRLSVDTVADELGDMGPEKFARERLGVWDADADSTDEDRLDVGAWLEMTDAESVAEQVSAFAVESDLSRAWASISVAGVRADGMPHVELVGPPRRGVRWIVERAAELDAEHGPVPWVIDGRGPVRELIPEFEDRGLQVLTASTDDVAQAYAHFVDGLRERSFRHGPQEELTAAVRASRRRPCGEAGFTFSQHKSGADLGPVKSAALALWAAATPPIDILQTIW
jgi:hypothetical protein